MTKKSVLRLGTRGSPLAIKQTQMAIEALAACVPGLGETGATSIVSLKTTGDQIQNRTLNEIGGKGLFTKEIDAALLDGVVDVGVHSTKDVGTWLPDGIEIAAYLPREDVRDAFICLKAKTLAELPENSVVGTASLRRGAQILDMRPDLKVVPIRGNVETRLAKLKDGHCDATILAYAGLIRNNMTDRAASVFDVAEMLPAGGQGAIALACRSSDEQTKQMLAKVNHMSTYTAVTAERAFLKKLDGSCRTPIASLATVDGAQLHFKGCVLSVDGRQRFDVEITGSADAPAKLGTEAGEKILQQAGQAFFDALAQRT